jgi:hypothetical protein
MTELTVAENIHMVEHFSPKMLMKVLKKETFWIHGAFLGGLV